MPKTVSAGARSILLSALVLGASCVSAQTSAVQRDLSAALQGTQASAVVVDLRTGALLAQSGVARTAAPGSVIKPLLLSYALDHDIVRPETEVYCRRNLRLGHRDLACTHPADQPVFNAESALAESCNTWFAAMARSFTGEQLEAALRQTRLSHKAAAQDSTEQRELTVLGLENVTASPLQLAQAYREMLLHAPAAVLAGLKDSVDFGMANPAAVKGRTVLGKTGTATNSGESWTHGWFAGAIPGRLVLVVYVPHGDGGTAARLAQKFFAGVPQP